MSSRIFHHAFAFLGSVFYSFVSIFLYQKGLLEVSVSTLILGNVIFWFGNLVCTGLFFSSLSELFKYKCLVLIHVSWGQLGLIALGYFSPSAIEISMMMSIATYTFVVFGISSIKLIPLVLITSSGFALLLFSNATEVTLGSPLLTLITYIVSGVFITVINAYVGNLQMFLENQNALIKSKSEELEAAHKELLEAKEEAEQSSKSKTRFLAAASHDLRQPLYALELYIGSLTNCPTKDIDHVITQMEKSAFELRELLNCLFDISRFDTEVTEANIKRVRLDHLLEGLEAEFKELAEKENRPLKVRSSRAVVKTDPILMHRVIRSLLANAIRHSKKGKVLMGVRNRGEHIVFEVWDSGVGIAKEDQDKIFEEFYQVKNSNRDRSQGLGLGLALIKRMCEVMNHEFGMRSVEGKGTVFWVKMEKSSQSDARDWALHTKEQNSQQSAGTILCIDDEQAILNGLHLLLSSWGYKAITAESHHDAIEQLRLTGEVPDLLLCDYRLADDVNGIEAIKHVNNFLKTELPCIIATGDLDKSIGEQTKRHSYKLLLKPVSPAKLKLYLRNMLAKSEPATT